MTIEEYLNNGVELEEMAMAHFERPSEDEEQRKIALAYSEGRRDVFKETLEKLSTFNYEATIREVKEMEHNVTLREVKEECNKHGGEEGCRGCVLIREPNFPSRNYCAVDCLANAWDIDDIQKRMREARND